MRHSLAQALVVAIVTTLVVSIQPVQSASAANAAQFDPGYIISDAAFYDGGEMLASAVQEFLVQRVPSCQSGYTCLKDYRQATPNMAASTYCTAYPGSAGERASDIIAKVGAACNISQKVLLVLLEKEQGLVSHTWPSQSRFDRATGFSCPDSAPCDPAYAGFFYQVYYAARQFQLYSQNPSWYNYLAGRTNYILFHPNTACGSSPVYIQNKATAGLYNYTPYQPNPAALANLYGTGDGCSSYGNRNFWRIYSDWFGSPTVATSLLRTIDNSTVYLVSGAAKYPIPSMQLLTALSPLGDVGYVSQRYLDSFATGHSVGRSLRSPNGTIYFYDAGIKLPFNSCALAVDYGASCEPSGFVQLTADQTAEFVTGPAMTRILGTSTGGRYYISGGTKAEIFDAQSQAEAGITGAMNVLTENALAHLRLVAPVIRDSVYALTRSTWQYSLIAGGQRYPISEASAVSLGVQARATGSLSASSIALMPNAGREFLGFVSDSEGTVSLLAASGRLSLTAGVLASSIQPVTTGPQLIGSYTASGSIDPGDFIKSSDRADVYVVMPTDIRPISGWNALLALTSDSSPVITTIPRGAVDSFAHGRPVALIAGSLVRSPENATVYLVNGVTSRIAVSSFLFPVEAGFSQLVFESEARIQTYPLAAQLMTFGLSCEGTKYVAAGGSVHLVDPTFEGMYPFEYVPMDQFTCGQLKIGTPATAFIRTPDGSIYQLVDGQKHPVSSMARFAELSGGRYDGWLDVVPAFAAGIPTGSAA